MTILTLKKTILFCLILLTSIPVNAQKKKYYTKSKKAIKHFETAYSNYNLKYFDLAKQSLAMAVSKDENFIDAYILFAEIANEENQKEKAIQYFSKAIDINNDYNSLMFLRRADLELETGQYEIAINDYNTFLSKGKLLKSYSDYVNKKINKCKAAIELKKHPVKFAPVNLGASINTNLSEYWPSLTADGKTITFTKSDRKTNSQEDLYHARMEKHQWGIATKIPPPINTNKSEGAQSISADGKTMVFTACLRPDGYGSCDLYISYKKGNQWSKPVNIGPQINTRYKESQPALSANGQTLFFASHRPDGKGKFDIWKSEINENGQWSKPENLGDSINTSEDELAPFIHYDNQTLYFSSEGHPGLGGSDMFIARKNLKGNWGRAINLGYPINTHFNEESMVVTANGELGLFSSNIDGGYGQKDIYQFQLPPKIKPQPTIFIKGIVYNAKTKAPLSANVNILDLKDSAKYNTSSDEINGQFLTCLAPNKNYSFIVEKKGYMFFSRNFSLPDSSIYIEIPLQPIEIGLTTVLNNIFFEYDSYKLKKESFPELKKLKEFIQSNNISIEIQGHTDNHGTKAYNQELSKNRAKAVYEYLLKKGVKKDKIEYKGYDYSMPLASNDTDEGRAKNRRTAFKILSISN